MRCQLFSLLCITGNQCYMPINDNVLVAALLHTCGCATANTAFLLHTWPHIYPNDFLSYQLLGFQQHYRVTKGPAGPA
jgi:hypothetical protein